MGDSLLTLTFVPVLYTRICSQDTEVMRGAKPAQVTECSLGYVKEEAALQNMLLSCLHYECTVGPIYDFRSIQLTVIFSMFIYFIRVTYLWK